MSTETAPPNATVAQIPARNDLPWYTFKMSLSATIFTLRFRFNTRMSRWILDLADPQNNDIIDSIPLLINRPLLEQYGTYAIPDGLIFVTDDTNTDTQPSRFSFGIDHTLWYYDPLGET